MKVALYNLTTTTRYGGVESFVWDVAKRLAQREHAVTIVGGHGSVRRPYDNVRVVTFPFLRRETQRQVPGLRTQYTATKLLERLTFGAASLRFMLRERFDLIHIQKPYDLPIAVLLKSRGAGKIVFGCHGTDFFPGDRKLARRVDIAVSASAFNASQIREHYGIEPRVVYNGIDPDVFHPLPDDAEFRRTLAPNSSTLLYVGRLVRWKGVQHLLEAAAKLVKQRKLCFLIAGEGEYRPELERRARELGITDSVKFLGYIPPDALPRYYAASEVTALASYANETFSISMVEAMACARPTVGTRFGGIPEVIADGQSGLLAKPENPDDLAEKIARLLDNRELREQMGQCGRQRALQKFTWDAVTDRVLEAYEEVFRSQVTGHSSDNDWRPAT